MLTVCLLILAALYFQRPIGELLEKLKNVDWRENFNGLWQRLEPYARKAGRTGARPNLQFYYVVTDSETTVVEKAIIYGCIAYVVLPVSLIPRAVYKFLGVMDEAAAVLLVYNKVKDKITPAINTKVEATLDQWFGAEYAVIED